MLEEDAAQDGSENPFAIHANENRCQKVVKTLQRDERQKCVVHNIGAQFLAQDEKLRVNPKNGWSISLLRSWTIFFQEKLS